MQRARLKDIAERVGCSIAVVSHVVNNSSGNISCRRSLREEILQTAADLDYTPHYASRALKSQRSNTIGVYIPPREGTSIGFTYESSIMTGIERVCREKAYDLLVISTGQEAEHDAECVSKLNARRVDGLILLHVEDDSRWMFPLAEKHRNIVAVNYHGEAQVDTINFDDRTAVGMAVAELHARGHRRISYVGPLHTRAGKGAQCRLEGFTSTCDSLGITVDPDRVFDEAFPGSPAIDRARLPQAQVIQHIAERIMNLPADKRPTAIIGYSDFCAIGVVQELQRLKTAIPDELSAVGIDNSEICQYVQPRLASIRQPLDVMGEQAARHIIAQTEKTSGRDHADPGPKPRWFKLAEPTFIPRESIRTLD